MKIAFVLTSLANVGPVIVVKDLISCLPDFYEISVYYLDDIKEVEFRGGVVVKKVGFFERVDLSGYDVVHSHMMRADYFVLLRRLGINFMITTMHSDFKKDLVISHGKIIGKLASALWYFSLFFFDKVVFLTKSQANRYSHIKKSCVIYNGRSIGVVPARVINKKKCDVVLLGACAHVVDRKGFDQVIDLMADNINYPYRFMLVGDGPALDKLKQYARDRGVYDKCEFTGRKSNVVDFIKDFDVYVMTSHSEGMPLALLEAAACGCPIVCSRLPEITEIFSASEISFYDINNIESLHAAVEVVVSSKEEFSRNVNKKFTEKYTDVAMCENYVETYSSKVN